MKHILMLSLFFAPTIARAVAVPVKTAPFVDLGQYLGVWYEIAAMPQWFERNCVANTKAEYARSEGDLISVVNSCEVEGGKRQTAVGRAKVVDATSNSKLKVTFVNIFGWQFLLGGKYWILAVGDNYSYAVIGEPDREYAWILSRTPKMSAPQLEEATQVLRDQGFDTCKLISTPQAGGLQERKSLCEVASTLMTK